MGSNVARDFFEQFPKQQQLSVKVCDFDTKRELYFGIYKADGEHIDVD